MANETATSSMMAANVRRREALAIGRSIFDEIADLIPAERRADVQQRIMETVHQNGVMLVRDEERQALGLSARDAAGWTTSERIRAEALKREALLAFSEVFIPSRWQPREIAKTKCCRCGIDLHTSPNDRFCAECDNIENASQEGEA